MMVVCGVVPETEEAYQQKKSQLSELATLLHEAVIGTVATSLVQCRRRGALMMAAWWWCGRWTSRGHVQAEGARGLRRSSHPMH